MTLDATNAPLHHLNATLLTPEQSPKWHHIWQALRARLIVNAPDREKHRGMFYALIGGSGPGKTQMGVELIRETIEKEWGAKYATANRFFLELKATYVKDSEVSEMDVLLQYAKPTMLVLDEMGKRKGTEWEDTLLYELLNQRYNSNKDTLLISNETPERFGAAIGASLTDRLGECGGIIVADWPSFRRAA